MKTSTSAVRTAYIECMNVCFHGGTLSQGSAVVEILANTLDRGGTGPGMAQIEALSAACLLLRLTTSGSCPEQYSNILWNVVLDMDKQFFVSEKFLSVASEDGKRFEYLKVELILSISVIFFYSFSAAECGPIK